MLNLTNLTIIIENYNTYHAGPVPIDVAIATPIIQVLTTRPPTIRTGVKIAKQPGPIRGNTAYVFRDSCNRCFILIKGNTQTSKGAETQPDQIGSGTTKIVKLYGGILLELDDALDVILNQPVITFSRVSEGYRRDPFPHSKFAALRLTVKEDPNVFLHTFSAIQFFDPITKKYRLILFQPKLGRDFKKVRKEWERVNIKPTLQQRVEAAFSFLEEIQKILRKSLWPVDLKPENTGYDEVAGAPVLTPFDYLCIGGTFTIFKKQYKAMSPLLKHLFKRPIDPKYNDELFNAVIKQLIFEIAHMLFLIFNPTIEYVYEARYDVYFTNFLSIVTTRGLSVCPPDAYLYNFFTSFCHNENFLALTPPSPDFGAFLTKIRTEFGILGTVPSQFTDAWIATFAQLVHHFRTSPAPVRRSIETLNITL